MNLPVLCSPRLILGLLFVVYSTPLSILSFHLFYADDTTLPLLPSIKFPLQHYSLTKRSTTDLLYMTANLLTLNSSKTEVFVIDLNNDFLKCMPVSYNELCSQHWLYFWRVLGPILFLLYTADLHTTGQDAQSTSAFIRRRHADLWLLPDSRCPTAARTDVCVRRRRSSMDAE